VPCARLKFTQDARRAIVRAAARATAARRVAPAVAARAARRWKWRARLACNAVERVGIANRGQCQFVAQLRHVARKRQSVAGCGPSSRTHAFDAGPRDLGAGAVPAASGTQPIGQEAMRGGMKETLPSDSRNAVRARLAWAPPTSQ
jgi:hypothetical protein